MSRGKASLAAKSARGPETLLLWWIPASLRVQPTEPKGKNAHNALAVCKLLRRVVLYCSLICQVALVSHEQPIDTLDRVALDLA